MSVRIRTVKDQQRTMMNERGLHELLQRGDIGVESGTDVLNVEDQDIDFSEVFFGGPSFTAVEGNDRNTGLLIHIITHFGSGISSTAESMFRTKDGTDFNTQAAKRVHQMGAIAEP